MINFFKIFRTKKIKIVVLILLVILILLAGGFIYFYKFMDYKKRGELLTDYPFLTKLLPIMREIRKLPDIVNFTYQLKKSDLPVYRLVIDSQDYQQLNDNLPPFFQENILTEEYKKFQPAKFYADGKEYNVQVRYRGDNEVHWNAPKKSWLIKFKEEQPFRGLKRLSFILPDDRGYIIEHLNNYRADKLSLIWPISDYTILEVNGQKHGLYFTIEGWSQEFLVNNQITDPTNLFGTTEVSYWNKQRILPFDGFYIWKKYVEDNIADYDNWADLYQLLDLVNNQSDDLFQQKIFDLVDKDNFYNWQIHSKLMWSSHAGHANARMYFDQIVGKFKIIPWDIGLYEPNQNLDVNYYKLVTKILAVPEFVHQRNKLLWQYIKDDNNLNDDLKFYDQIYGRIKTALYNDRLKIYSNRHADKEISRFREMIIYNYRKLQELIKEARVAMTIHIYPDQLSENNQPIIVGIEVRADNFSGLSFNGLSLPYQATPPVSFLSLYEDTNHDRIFNKDDKALVKIPYNNETQTFQIDDLDILLFVQREVAVADDEPFKLIPTDYYFWLTANQKLINDDFNWDDLEIKITNAVTKENIKDDDKIIRLVNEDSFKYFDQISVSAESFYQRYPFFRSLTNNIYDLTLEPGSYNINSTIIIPKGFSLTLQPGTILNFASQTSLISYSPVRAQGTSKAPIIFTTQNINTPWGVFGVVDNGANNSVFDYCLFEYGSEAYINGIVFSGNLSIHSADVKVTNSRFQFASGDDALNIKNAQGDVNYNYFYHNEFDAVDLDWASGIVQNNYFFDNGNDGLDLGGVNNLKIINNLIKKNGDKGLSIGERSKNIQVINNLILDSITGIAVKDDSQVEIFNNTLVNNQTGLAVYEKKPVFGGAKPVVYNTIIWGSDQSITVDNKSDIDISYSDIQGGYSGVANIDLVPPFVNPNNDNYLLNQSGLSQQFKQVRPVSDSWLASQPVVMGIVSQPAKFIPF